MPTHEGQVVRPLGVLEASPYVLSTIESGYILPLKSEPTSHYQRNQATAMQNVKFVQQSI